MFTKYENKAMSDFKTKELKLNADLRGKSKGEIVRVSVDNLGTPLDKYWRNRVKDAEIDNCVEFLEKKVTKNKKD